MNYEKGVAAALAFVGVPKYAEVVTPLLPHQERVRRRIQEQPGLVVAHGLGSGKCSKGDTLVYTSVGLVRIDSLFDQFGQPKADEEILPAGNLKIVHWKNGVMRWAPVAALYRQKLPDDEPTITLKTKRGNTLTCTQAHPMPVVREGRITWVPAAQVKRGDWLAVSSHLPHSETPSPWTVALARLLTWQVCEGWENTKAPTFAISQKDPAILFQLLQDFRQVVNTKAGSVKISPKGVGFFRVQNPAYKALLEKFGYVWGHKSSQKCFPDSLLLAPEAVAREVVRAFWEAEGHMSKVNAEISSASKLLLEQLRILLLRFGVRTSINSKQACATNGTRIMRTYWRLSISGDDLRRLLEVVRDPSSYKTTALLLVTSKKSNANYGVPVNWVYDLLPGYPAKVVGCGFMGLRCDSIDPSSVSRWVEHLHWLGIEGARHYAQQAKRLGGTAAKWSTRTAQLLDENMLDCTAAAVRLEKLAASGLRFEPITSIDKDAPGGWVYDLSVAADEYGDKNYVIAGGLIAHNTLSSIAAADALGMPTNVVVPAALQANYLKELNKHRTNGDENVNIHSLQKVTGMPDPALNEGLMIVDEAHRIRDPATRGNQLFRKYKPDKKLLLTASPVYNHPSDLGALVNLAASQKLLPDDRKEFEQAFTRTKKISPGFWGTLRGIKPGEKRVLHNEKQLGDVLSQWVDYHGNAAENFPNSTEENVSVPMSKRQQEIYDTLLGKAPAWVRYKIRRGLPPSKAESSNLTTFLSGQRQVSNSPQPFVKDMSNAEAVSHSPKIQEAFRRLKQKVDENPAHKAVVYSNYLQGGLAPYQHLLDEAKIPYGMFTGDMKKSDRDQMVRDYNENKLKALLLSSAGGEGLDLKGTRQIQLLEPHFNEEKLRQIIGRGIRYKSHEHLPEDQRHVNVERYMAENRPTLWNKFWGDKNKSMAADQYLANLSKSKLELNDQVIELLKKRQAEREQQS